MSQIDKTIDFENLRKVVEAIDEMTDDDQIQAPEADEVAEELDVSIRTISRWTDGDYKHAVRTAGLIPRRDRNIGDYMVLYDELNKSGEEITREVVEETPISPLGSTDKNLSHNQAREKIGLNPNSGRPEVSFFGKVYGEGGKIYGHRLRGIILRFLEEKDRVPSIGELVSEISIPDDLEYDQLKKVAGSPSEPIYVEGQGYGFLSADRENEVFDFWVREYLERDWTEYNDTEIDTIMRMRMTEENIPEIELDAVAEQYSKWVDFDRYQS